eukprot:COSAG01_NODE_6455_length_3657_cov_2.617416_5_plen_49_part_00
MAALNTDTEMQDYGRIIDGPADPAWRSMAIFRSNMMATQSLTDMTWVT